MDAKITLLPSQFMESHVTACDIGLDIQAQADHHKAGITAERVVGFLERGDIGQGRFPVSRPEIQEHELPAQGPQIERPAIGGIPRGHLDQIAGLGIEQSEHVELDRAQVQRLIAAAARNAGYCDIALGRREQLRFIAAGASPEGERQDILARRYVVDPKGSIGIQCHRVLPLLLVEHLAFGSLPEAFVPRTFLVTAVVGVIVGLPWFVPDRRQLAESADQVGQLEALGNLQLADDGTALAADFDADGLAGVDIHEDRIRGNPAPMVRCVDITIDRDRAGVTRSKTNRPCSSVVVS